MRKCGVFILAGGIAVNKELFKLPVLTLMSGVMLQIADYITALILVRDASEWTLEMGTIAFCIQLLLSVALFIVIGIIVRKLYDRKNIAKSATLLVIYSIVVLALEQITQYFGTYNMIVHFLYFPVYIFTVITHVLARISSAKSINWLYVIPSLFAPYLFVLFSKKAPNEN